jgi:phosphatidate cytidylyltransferase
LNKKNLLTRAGAGIIYIAVLLAGILVGKYSFLIVFGTILGFGLYEFYKAMEKNTSHAISKTFNIVSGIIIFLSAYLYLENINAYLFPATSLIYLLALTASAVLISREDILHAIIYSVFGQIYITLPLSLLMLLSYQYNIWAKEYHYLLVLAIFVLIWINDTAAYFIGSLIGKHKLIERISPKKSVEGLIAGIIFTLLGSLIFAHCYPQYPLKFWIGFALVISLFGTVGDLFESLIKRTCGIKDAGNLIPGHGGILDRIDSLLIAIPAAYLYLMMFAQIIDGIHP